MTEDDEGVGGLRSLVSPSRKYLILLEIVRSEEIHLCFPSFQLGTVTLARGKSCLSRVCPTALQIDRRSSSVAPQHFTGTID